MDALTLLQIFGGAEGDRTPDLMNAIHALSQLSYGPFLNSAKPADVGASNDRGEVCLIQSVARFNEARGGVECAD